MCNLEFWKKILLCEHVKGVFFGVLKKMCHQNVKMIRMRALKQVNFPLVLCFPNKFWSPLHRTLP